MKVVNPLQFAVWRAADFVTVAAKWFALAARYRRILRRVAADEASVTYTDEAMRPASPDHENAEFVTTFADKIPNTYGAPPRLGVATS
jgi:hypothetical protein